MEFDFVLLALFSNKMPPLSKKINEEACDYKFAPLSNSGAIYSIDATLWGLKASEENIFCPSKSDIETWLEDSIRYNSFFVAALCNHKDFEPPGSSGAKVKLASWKEITKEHCKESLLRIGFDVVDSWTGISAVNNIGYNEADLTQINSLGLKANEYGLFNSIIDATSFAQLVCNIAPEHAPYEVVEIYARFPA